MFNESFMRINFRGVLQGGDISFAGGATGDEGEKKAEKKDFIFHTSRIKKETLSRNQELLKVARVVTASDRSR